MKVPGYHPLYAYAGTYAMLELANENGGSFVNNEENTAKIGRKTVEIFKELTETPEKTLEVIEYLKAENLYDQVAEQTATMNNQLIQSILDQKPIMPFDLMRKLENMGAIIMIDIDDVVEQMKEVN